MGGRGRLRMIDGMNAVFRTRYVVSVYGAILSLSIHNNRVRIRVFFTGISYQLFVVSHQKTAVTE